MGTKIRFGLAVLLVSSTTTTAWPQSAIQRRMAQEYPIMLTATFKGNAGQKTVNHQVGGIEQRLGAKDKVRTKVMNYDVRVTSNAKKGVERFSFEAITMARIGKKEFPCHMESFPIALMAKSGTNIMVRSAAATSRDVVKVDITGVRETYNVRTGETLNRSYDYNKSAHKEGAVIKGMIFRVKKNGVIIRTWCSDPSAAWKEIAWKQDVETAEVPKVSEEAM